MNETDAVSCLLCLQADEYGSMIKVCVPPGRIPPSPERVVCRRCAGAITAEYQNLLGEVIEGVPIEQPVDIRAVHPGADPDGSDRDGGDSDNPDRALEPPDEAHRADDQNATGSSKVS